MNPLIVFTQHVPSFNLSFPRRAFRPWVVPAKQHKDCELYPAYPEHLNHFGLCILILTVIFVARWDETASSHRQHLYPIVKEQHHTRMRYSVDLFSRGDFFRTLPGLQRLLFYCVRSFIRNVKRTHFILSRPNLPTAKCARGNRPFSRMI